MEFENIEDNIKFFIDKHQNNKLFTTSSFIKILKSMIDSFREYFEKLDNISDWDSIIFKIEYDINNNLEINTLIQENYINILKILTKNTKIIEENENSNFDIPEKYLEKIKKLPKEKQASELNKLIDMDPIIIKPKNDKPAIAIKIKPLIINNKENTCFYRVLLKFISGNSKPYRWKDDSKNNFWETVQKHLSNFNSENLPLFEELETPLKSSRSDIKNINNPKKLIKTGLHTELQKFGGKDKKLSSMMKLLTENNESIKGEIEEYKIDVIGIDITKVQNQALFAVQVLLDETNYKGHSKTSELKKETNSFKFSGELPIIRFTPAKYLDAFGVNKKVTKREKFEYHGNQRSEALKALEDLSKKKYLFHYKKKYWKEGKEVYDIVTTVRNLYNLTYKYEAVNKNEIALLKEEKTTSSLEKKLSFIELEPCPLLVDQMQTYFVLKPANFYQEINLELDRPSKQVVLFIEFLIAEVTKKEMFSKSKNEEMEWKIEISIENLVYKLRMESLLEGNRISRIKTQLKKCYDSAKKLGYLVEEINPGKDLKSIEKLVLNPDKFRRVKEISEELKKEDFIF